MSYKVGFCPRGSPHGLSAIALHLLHTEMVGHMASHSSAGLTSLFPEQVTSLQASARGFQFMGFFVSWHQWFWFLEEDFLVSLATSGPFHISHPCLPDSCKWT